ncbi:MAG TPA: DUF5362 family protein [Chitinophagaceae bacterium]|nr:DUF5362 family protein [Chitinophagaceae bacterium]
MEQNQDSSLFGINVDQTAKSHLAEAAKWAKFLSIIGFISCGFLVLIGIFFGSFMSMFSSQYGNNPYSELPTSSPEFGAAMAVVYIIIALIYFFPCLFLFRFATKMKAALASNDQEVLNTSFQNLKASFRYVGIITIVMLAFWVLAFIVGLLGAATGSNM